MGRRCCPVALQLAGSVNPALHVDAALCQVGDSRLKHHLRVGARSVYDQAHVVAFRGHAHPGQADTEVRGDAGADDLRQPVASMAERTCSSCQLLILVR